MMWPEKFNQQIEKNNKSANWKKMGGAPLTHVILLGDDMG